MFLLLRVSRYLCNGSASRGKIEEMQYSIRYAVRRSGLWNGIRYSTIIPRRLPTFAFRAFIEGISLALPCNENWMPIDGRLVSLLIAQNYLRKLPRSDHDSSRHRGSRLFLLLRLANFLSRGDNSRGDIIVWHKRDSDKSISLCDYWGLRGFFSRCYRKMEGFII